MQAIYDRDIDRGAIEAKTIAVIGYGSQGRAQALNLRDSGCKVIVGLRADSSAAATAQRDGFASRGSRRRREARRRHDGADPG